MRVTLGDLLGQPVLVEHDNGLADGEDDVQAIRDTLMAPARLSRVLFAEQDDYRPQLDSARTAQLTESTWSDYQDGRLGRTIGILPHLIRTAQQHEGENSAAGWAISARVHHLAATTSSKIGEADLAWIAAERSMRAADMADDPLVLGSAARAGTHALLSVGRYDDALELGHTARSWLAAHTVGNEPAALSLLGMLDLRMAIAAARHNERQLANDLLDRAGLAADQLGQNANYWQTAFGPTNVALHRISAALDLGDTGYVVEHGPRIDPAPLPLERRICHRINIARAYSDLAQDDSAVDNLLSAERQAPQFVLHHPIVREVLRAIHRRAATTMARRQAEVAAFAQRCRAVP